MTAYLFGLVDGVVGSVGYLGIIALMAAESACLPVPSEIVLPFAGYLVARGQMNLIVAATAGAIGCNLGSLAAYEIGRWGGRPLARRWSRLPLVGAGLRQAERFFDRYGTATILVGRLLPTVRTYIALPAGVAAMPRIPFHLLTFVGSWIWCLALTWAGVLIERHFASAQLLHQAFRYGDLAIAAAAVALAGLFAWRLWRRRVAAGAEP